MVRFDKDHAFGVNFSKASTQQALADIGGAFAAASNNPFAIGLNQAAQRFAQRSKDKEVDEETRKFVEALKEDPNAPVPENLSAEAAGNALKMATQREQLEIGAAEAGGAVQRVSDEERQRELNNLVLANRAITGFRENQLQERFGEQFAEQKLQLNRANINRLVADNAFNKDTIDDRKRAIALERKFAEDTFESNVDLAKAKAEYQELNNQIVRQELQKIRDGLPNNVKNIPQGQFETILRTAIIDVDPNNPALELHDLTGTFDAGMAMSNMDSKTRGLLNQRLSDAVNAFQRTQDISQSLDAINPFAERPAPQGGGNPFVQPQRTPPPPTPQPSQQAAPQATRPPNYIPPPIEAVPENLRNFYDARTGVITLPNGKRGLLLPDGNVLEY